MVKACQLQIAPAHLPQQPILHKFVFLLAQDRESKETTLVIDQ